MNSLSFNLPLFLLLVVCSARAAQTAVVNSPSRDNPYDQCTFLATHNAYANPDDDTEPEFANQPESITEQLDYGVRVINLDLWLGRQKQNFVGCWIWEAYPKDSADTTPGNRFSTGDPLQVLVGHGLDSPFAGLLIVDCAPLRTLTSFLNEIETWVSGHPGEVVTIVFETVIHGSHEDLITDAIEDSRLHTRARLFHPNGPNPNVPAPQGRTGGWRVDRYGYPTLRHMTDHGKSVVLFPPYLPSSADNSWKLEVATVYGAACLPPNNANRDWVKPRSESAAIDDFTRPLFSLIHVPNLPTATCFGGPGCVNDIGLFRQKQEDVEVLYNRLPTAVWVDYYERGFNETPTPADQPAGPALFVNELNALRDSLPAITGTAQIVPPPSAYGWNNTDVQVLLGGSGGDIQAVISRKWTGQVSSPAAFDQTSHILQNEGITTVSFYAVGPLGKRSPNEMFDVAIDKTPPTITGMLDRPPDGAGWYASDVTAHFECSDTRSGVAYCQPDIVLSEEGADQSVTGVSVDRADNTSTATLSGINIDKSGPVIRATAGPSILWPPNGKLTPVIVLGRITDAGSGVDPAAVKYSVTDEYRKFQEEGPVLLDSKGKFSLKLRLEAGRAGGDADGRHYFIRLDATDRVGHSSWTNLTITVPHDQRRAKAR